MINSSVKRLRQIAWNCWKNGQGMIQRIPRPRSSNPRPRFQSGIGQADFAHALETRQLLSVRPSVPVHAEVRLSHVDSHLRVSPMAARGRTINHADATIYLPRGFKAGRSYPVAVVFTPDGKLSRTLGNWKAIADRFHLIVYASKEYSNVAIDQAENPDQFAAMIRDHVVASLSQLPVDHSHVMLAGFSGGGFMAEYLNGLDPSLASAVVIDANGFYAYGQDPFLPLPNGTNRTAAFLYSPTDQLFGGETQADYNFYLSQGWTARTFTYSGGHVDAPRNLYLKAVGWVVKQPSWRR